MMRKEIEKKLVLICEHSFKEIVTLQLSLSKVILSDFHWKLDLQLIVTTKILDAMSGIDIFLFRKLLLWFYPYFIKLVCNDQMKVKKVLGEFFFECN